MTNEERYKVILNIVAKVGIDGDIQGEYARTMSALHGMDSMNAMQAQIPVQPIQPTAPLSPNNEAGGMMPQEQVQTPPMQQEGQGSLNLP